MEPYQTTASAKRNVTGWRRVHLNGLNGLNALWDCRRRTRHFGSILSRQRSLVAPREACGLVWHIRLCCVVNRCALRSQHTSFDPFLAFNLWRVEAITPSRPQVHPADGAKLELFRPSVEDDGLSFNRATPLSDLGPRKWPRNVTTSIVRCCSSESPSQSNVQSRASQLWLRSRSKDSPTAPIALITPHSSSHPCANLVDTLGDRQ